MLFRSSSTMKKVAFIFLLVSILLSFVLPVFASEYELRLAVTATPPHPWIDAYAAGDVAG